MAEESETDIVSIISELPQGIMVHDMVFDWEGKRIALACSDKTVKIYVKSYENTWFEESVIKIQGASVWKMKWIRPEFGILLATCSLDRTIKINEWKLVNKAGVQKYEWQTHVQAVRGVEDFKISPSLQYGLIMSTVTTQGTLEIKEIKETNQSTLSNMNTSVRSTKLEICKLGLNCLSWNKDESKKYSIFAIGCKSHLTTPLKVLEGTKTPENNVIKIEPINTVEFVYFDSENYMLEKIQCPALKGINSAVNDISWAFVNGRSYHLLAIATDTFTKVFEINLKSLEENSLNKSVEIMKEYTLSQNAGFRLSWNILGTYLSVSEHEKIQIFRCLSRGVWGRVREVGQQG